MVKEVIDLEKLNLLSEKAGVWLIFGKAAWPREAYP